MKVSWFRKNPFHCSAARPARWPRIRRLGINSHNQLFDQEGGKGVAISSTPEFVDKLYLITDFYEYGWGESFHFAAKIGESFEASIIRQETGTSPPEPARNDFRHVPVWRSAGGATVRHGFRLEMCARQATRSLFLRFPRPDLTFPAPPTRLSTQPSPRPSA